MATLFNDPYKMYYDKLKGSISLTSSGNEISSSGSSITNIMTRLSSQIQTAIWNELGYKELLTVSIPALSGRCAILQSNLSILNEACKKAMNSLLPNLTSLKEKCESYEEVSQALSSLVEPDRDDKNYNDYLRTKRSLEQDLKNLYNEIETLKVTCDSDANAIKALDGSIKDFTGVTISSGNIPTQIEEVVGLTLTEDETTFVAALEKSLAEEAEVEGISYEDKLNNVSGLYTDGKTILYNDVGGQEYGYSRKIQTSHGKLVTVFQQGWNQRMYFSNSNKTLASGGCGFNALASILSSKYSDITPEKVFSDMGRKFMYASDIKNYLESVYNIKVGSREEVSRNDYSAYKQHLVEEVSKGNMVMTTVGPGPDAKYTKSNHWVAIVDYDKENDQFYVTDSNDPNDSNAGPIDADTFLKKYSINTNVVYIADDSGYIC